MAKTSLPPGFRFHPTDIELVNYYLKRKVMQKKLPRGVISELDVYKYAPWDLPEQSSLKSGDLKWYFFCPSKKKYASGIRRNRATEFGFWKTTGKDKPIVHNNEVSGQRKTLIFHRGSAPRGDRTNWVMHEYRLEDADVTVSGFSQDAYVICMIFQKDGPGPRNGAQYGAPFEECEWDDDDEDEVVNSVEPSPSTGLLTCHPVNISNDPNNSNTHDPATLSVNHYAPANDSCISGIVPSVSNEAILVPADEISPTEQIPNNFNDDDDIAMMLNQYTSECEVGNPTHGNADPELGLYENNFCNGLGDLANSINPTSLSNNYGQGFYAPVMCSSSSRLCPFDGVPYLELDDLMNPIGYAADGGGLSSSCLCPFDGVPYLEFDDLMNPIGYAADGGGLLPTSLPCSLATSSGVGPLVNPNQFTLENLHSFDLQMDNCLTNPGTSGQKFHEVGHPSVQPENLYEFDCCQDLVNEENNMADTRLAV